MLGMLGVGSGVLASLLAAGFSPEVLTQFGTLATLGTLAGKLRLALCLKKSLLTTQASSSASESRPRICPRPLPLCTPSSVLPLS